jgi:DNA-binding PucR family transcriptional regulator
LSIPSSQGAFEAGSTSVDCTFRRTIGAMALTVRDILAIPGLAIRLVAGAGNEQRPVRWVHSSELEDPTPWLQGGEILLTTGAAVGSTPAKQRAYVKRLCDAGLAGLGFGLGFGHDRVPKAIVSAADECDFPVFEVPYPVPFIAITEAVFSRLLSEQYEMLQRAVDAEHVLTRSVMEGGGIEGVATSLADVTGGWALLLDLHGLPVATTSVSAEQRAERIWEELRDSRPEGTGFSLTLVDQGQSVSVQPVGAQGRVEAFLAVGTPEPLTQLDRIVVGHALSLFAIELAKSRAVAEAERRLQGDFFDALAGGSLAPGEVARGLTRFGFARDREVVVVAIEVDGDTDGLAYAAEDHLSRSGGPFLISPTAAGANLLVTSDDDLDVRDLRKAIAERFDGGALRAGAGSAVAPSEAGRSLREARYALQVCRLEGWEAAGFEDLGTYRLLLSMAEPDALRAFSDSLLAPLDAYDEAHGGELQASLRAFLQHNARWETAAAELYVHRHTLRYRMRKVEELTGRDLGSSFDRMEFWLALRARELLAAQDAEA